jgi:ribosomal protein L34E
MGSDPKTYPVQWEGQLILACRKCQKKLKGDPDLRPLAKLKKTVKRFNKRYPEKALHIINVVHGSMSQGWSNGLLPGA